MLSPYIFIGLEKNIHLFEMLANRVPEAKMDVSTGAGRFTARQALAHWADWDAIHLSRIDAAVAQDLAPVPDYDEGARCIELNYDSWTVPDMIARFKADREHLIARFKSLSEEELGHRMVHSHFGTLSVAGYAGHIVGHDAYHVEQMVAVCLG